MENTSYLKLNPVKFGLTAGIILGVTTFLSTILGIFNLSQGAEFMATTMWANYGYSVSWSGAFIGLIIAFVYGFLPFWVGAIIYNNLLKKKK